MSAGCRRGFEDVPARLAEAKVTDRGEIERQVVPAIAETVKKQVDIGIDCINDGEFFTSRSAAHYAAHFAGIEVRPLKPGEPALRVTPRASAMNSPSSTARWISSGRCSSCRAKSRCRR
jgi:methionine synthase II (cobalamin-independent)